MELKKGLLIGLIVAIILISGCVNQQNCIDNDNNDICDICEIEINNKDSEEITCTSSYACPEGTSCVNSKCVSTGAITGGGLIPSTCGNDIYDKGETYQNCPRDCKIR